MNYLNIRKSKAGRVFPVVIVLIPPEAVSGWNNHREDAPHFTNKSLSKKLYFQLTSVQTSD